MAVAFRGLPASFFPITIELLDAETRETVWSHVVYRPGGTLHIPGLDETSPRPKAVRVTYADGSVVYSEPKRELWN